MEAEQEKAIDLHQYGRYREATDLTIRGDEARKILLVERHPDFGALGEPRPGDSFVAG
jgi:hypothetical protein